MELRHLRYFVAVAEELNFRRAAERLHVSRPALSKQIKELESEIGVRLLERDTVRVELTRAGEGFLKDARGILAHSEEAVRRCAEVQNGDRGTLKIGSVGPIATEFLPRAIKLFRQRCPGVEIVFVEVPPVEQPQAVSRGLIDIAFAYGLDLPDDSRLQHLCAVKSNFSVAVSMHHPWAKRKSIGLEELGENRLLAIGNKQKSGHRHNLNRMWMEEGLVFPVFRHVESYDIFLNMISADQGISLLPEVLDLRNHGIAIVPLVTKSASRDFHMWVLWRKDMSASSAKPFVEVLKEILPE